MSKIRESRLILQDMQELEIKSLNEKINDLYKILNVKDISKLQQPQQEKPATVCINLNFTSKNNKFLEKPMFIPSQFFIKYAYIQTHEEKPHSIKISATIDNKRYQFIEKTNQLQLQEYKWSVNFPSENNKGFLLDFNPEEKIPDNIRLFIILEKIQRF